MDTALVIKVKYGDFLRRFSAHVDENNQLDLDMIRVRAKILSLFNIPADVNFILRYVDEDGDLVTLLDDDDLRDVMRQHLKFLRIDVHMSDDSVGKSSARSNGSATPLRSPTVPSGNVAIADAVKSVPYPLLKTLPNFSPDFVSKAASSSPGVATLADCVPKMGPSILNSDCQPQVAAVESNSSASQQVETGNFSRGVVAGVASVGPNILPYHPCPSQSTDVNTALLSSAVPDGDGKMGKASTCEMHLLSTSYAVPDNISTQITAMGPTSSLFAECPFSGTYITNSVTPSFGNHCKRSCNHTEAIGGVFHKGIICDCCGVYPITGPYCKSKVRKENYDLCSFHLNEIGNGTDHIKMDHPLSVRSPRCFESVYEHHPFRTGAISNHARPKLDSWFILDVSVIDGTIMAPSTAFTKIWRMKNNGTSVWPKGTQLVWIGGNMLVDSQSVDLEIPEDGVPVDKVLDIAVELRAPKLPGRYISYWRMAYPSCQYFGQSIRVLIQVEAIPKDSFYDGSQDLDLNIPCDDSGYKGSQVLDINVKPIIDEAFLQPHNSTAPTKPVKQKVDEQLRLQMEKDFPINKFPFDGHSTSSPATSVAPFSVSEKALVVPSNQQSLAVDAPSSSMVVGRNNSVEVTLLEELEEMGFKEVDVDKDMLNEYNLEQSVDDLSSSTSTKWDLIFEEMEGR